MYLCPFFDQRGIQPKRFNLDGRRYKDGPTVLVFLGRLYVLLLPYLSLVFVMYVDHVWITTPCRPTTSKRQLKHSTTLKHLT